MKSIFTLLCVFFIFSSTTEAQVGIGIETPDPSSVLHLESDNGGLLLPRLTTSQRDAIVAPATGLVIYNTDTNGMQINTNLNATPTWSLFNTTNVTSPIIAPSVSTVEMNLLPSTFGSLVFNTTENCLYQYKSNRWQSLCEAESSKIVTLHATAGTLFSSGTGQTFYDLPLGTSSMKEIDTDYFEIVGNGKVRVKEAGSYQINASISVTNLKEGSRKYILAVFDGSTRVGYLARGFATIPTGNPNGEWFGASGVFQYYFAKDAIINISYLINNGADSLSGGLMHIGIVKL